jgi:predicted signal transduction protein with EAL and GGDEF domain
LRILARADAAMYRARHQERSAVEVFDTSLAQQMAEREDVERALAPGLAAGWPTTSSTWSGGRASIRAA